MCQNVSHCSINNDLITPEMYDYSPKNIFGFSQLPRQPLFLYTTEICSHPEEFKCYITLLSLWGKVSACLSETYWYPLKQVAYLCITVARVLDRSQTFFSKSDNFCKWTRKVQNKRKKKEHDLVLSLVFTDSVLHTSPSYWVTPLALGG